MGGVEMGLDDKKTKKTEIEALRKSMIEVFSNYINVKKAAFKTSFFAGHSSELVLAKKLIDEINEIKLDNHEDFVFHAVSYLYSTFILSQNALSLLKVDGNISFVYVKKLVTKELIQNVEYPNLSYTDPLFQEILNLIDGFNSRKTDDDYFESNITDFIDKIDGIKSINTEKLKKSILHNFNMAKDAKDKAEAEAKAKKSAAEAKAKKAAAEAKAKKAEAEAKAKKAAAEAKEAKEAKAEAEAKKAEAEAKKAEAEAKKAEAEAEAKKSAAEAKAKKAAAEAKAKKAEKEFRTASPLYKTKKEGDSILKIEMQVMTKTNKSDDPSMTLSSKRALNH
jgi:hypothetical protein